MPKFSKTEREQYLTQLCKDKGYNEAQTATVLAKAEAIASDDAGSMLLDDVLSLPIKGSADYQRQMTELKKKGETLDKWHKDASATVSNALTAKQALEAKLKKVEAKFGPIDEMQLDDDGNLRNPEGKKVTGIKVEEVKELLSQEVQTRDAFYLGLIAEMGSIRARHAKMFKGELIDDSEILREVSRAAEAGERLSAEQAYQNLYGEKVTAAQKQLEADREAKLRAEGAEEERKRLLKNGMGRSGAAIGEQGIAFAAINSEGKADDENRKLTEDDRLSLFAQELSNELSKTASSEA